VRRLPVRTSVVGVLCGLGSVGLMAGALASPASASGAVSGSSSGSAGDSGDVRHVLLLSVDGMHQSDLSWYVKAHRASKGLARLVGSGTSYTHALTPFPSDSFPGLVGQVTGGNPGTTGIWYDVSYNAALLAPGTTTCTGAGAPALGTTVAYDESIDLVSTSIDAGQGLAGLPGSILSMTGQPRSLINPAALPVDPATCAPVYPHSYLRVNNVFNVLRANKLRTAWSDKHAAYEILNGPSGDGVQDLFTPEINSSTDPANPDGDDWTQDNAKTQQYDAYKVSAVLNEVDGYDHSRSTRVGVPALFGMNFQSVSTAQKLPTSGGLAGGYLADGVTPGPVLTSALDFVDAEVAALLAELDAQRLTGSTAVILSAKHGQSPQDGASLNRIKDGTILDALDAAWIAAGGSGPLVAGGTNDDAMIMWLTDRSPKATAFAKSFLLAYNGNGTGSDGKATSTDLAGTPKPYTSAGLSSVLIGKQLDAVTGARASDGRVPDLIGIAQHGVVYTGGEGKISEHGGADLQDRNVPLVVSTPGDGARRGRTVGQTVETTQIAPTVLSLLDLNPKALDAVRIEGTQVLPGR